MSFIFSSFFHLQFLLRLCLYSMWPVILRPVAPVEDSGVSLPSPRALENLAGVSRTLSSLAVTGESDPAAIPSNSGLLLGASSLPPVQGSETQILGFLHPLKEVRLPSFFNGSLQWVLQVQCGTWFHLETLPLGWSEIEMSLGPGCRGSNGSPCYPEMLPEAGIDGGSYPCNQQISGPVPYPIQLSLRTLSLPDRSRTAGACRDTPMPSVPWCRCISPCISHPRGLLGWGIGLSCQPQMASEGKPEIPELGSGSAPRIRWPNQLGPTL